VQTESVAAKIAPIAGKRTKEFYKTFIFSNRQKEHKIKVMHHFSKF
jgi:hypothetical protein